VPTPGHHQETDRADFEKRVAGRLRNRCAAVDAIDAEVRPRRGCGQGQDDLIDMGKIYPGEAGAFATQIFDGMDITVRSV
jgi:hypothetical protein